MAKKTPIKPTEAELEILQVLWQYGPNTVRFVNEKLNEKKPTGYTTTLKFMQLMTQKNMLRRDEQNRSHIYEAIHKEQETQQHLLDHFLKTTFQGSATNLVMKALGSGETTADDLEQIKALIKKIEGGRK